MKQRDLEWRAELEKKILLCLFRVLKLFSSVGTDVIKHYNTMGVHRSFPRGVVS